VTSHGRHGVSGGPRALTQREREILLYLLSVESPGVAELRQQAETALAASWECCGCASIELTVDRLAAPRSIVSGLAIEASANERAEQFFELLLWVDDGWLSAIEVVNYLEQQEQPPGEIPPPAELGPPTARGTTA
jgi:hypothetical protein